ncbi:hypothetical protein QQS21_010225 [Conoideocrella luteorostrata]|uniref:Fucose-specific lectin n=1 Tax=Conoideocrella luteorostrata TaxID=1105319 RepID=A0AAJ0CFL3_9HYPO|nr:hypothetical protein QQS21_010225 [Conoideocrella luteorostrata]
MSGVTSIINPGKPTEVLLFSTNNKLYVSLSAKKTTDSKDTVATLGTSDASDNGPMMKNSALASLPREELLTVYGVETKTTNNGTTTNTVAEICLISPVYQPLGLYSEETYGRIATTLRPDDDGTYSAFLYYRKKGELGTIYEYPLWEQDPDEHVLTPNKVGDETFLTTYYDTKKSARHIIFQDKDGSIHDYDITEDSRVRLTNTTDAINPTPLAAAWRADTSMVYLYYSVKEQEKYKLRRVTRSDEGIWNKPSFLKKTADMSATTQVSATPTTNGCHVFYEGAKGGYQHYIDKGSVSNKD